MATSQAAQAQRLQVLGLQCEYLQALGVQHSAPTLSWQLRADQRNVTQTAYRILVSDTTQALSQHIGTIGDSGKVTASTSLQMPYAGRTLGAGHTYYWQVQVWDNHCHASSWPEPAAWQMDMLSPQD